MDQDQGSKKKQFYKRWWFWVIVVVVLLIVIGASNSSSPHVVGQTQNSTERQQTTFKVGDQIQNGDTVLTVTKVNKNWQSSNEFDTPQNPGDVYVVVTVSLTNKGSDTLSLSGGWGFKLQDANGEQVNESLGGVGLNKIDSVSSLAPNGTATGNVIFEVPASATSNLTLIYQPLFSASAPINVQLQ
jgi:type II secretory pathway pseudopilin PulG